MKQPSLISLVVPSHLNCWLMGQVFALLMVENCSWATLREESSFHFCYSSGKFLGFFLKKKKDLEKAKDLLLFQKYGCQLIYNYCPSFWGQILESAANLGAWSKREKIRSSCPENRNTKPELEKTNARVSWHACQSAKNQLFSHWH